MCSQMEVRTATGEAALHLASQLCQACSFEAARGLLERCCLREQQGGASAGPPHVPRQQQQAALLPRLRAALGWVVLQQQSSWPDVEGDDAELAAAAALFDEVAAQDPSNLEVRGRQVDIVSCNL
jgi:hypothetical protein